MTARPEPKTPELVSAVSVREAANILHSMACDYELAIESARKTARALGRPAHVGDMQRKRRACLLAHRLLLFMLGIET